VWREQYGFAFPLIVAATLSDLADGWLARRWGVNSPVGAYLDPMADKALLMVTYAAMGASGAAPAWLVLVVLGRDAMILLGAGLIYRLRGRREFPPTRWGKVSTFFQMLFAGGVVLSGAYAGLLPAWLLTAALWAAAGATVFSGLDYVRVGMRLLRP
jgi:cardiolipin synthase